MPELAAGIRTLYGDFPRVDHEALSLLISVCFPVDFFRGAGAVIMPGVPGAGKSTLCAAFGLSGWRTLSDEHALIPPGTRQVVPLCRPVSLKNESIEVIRRFSSQAVFGPPSHDTHKGTVQHMKGDLHPDSHATEPLPVRALVFPRFSRDERQRLQPRFRTVSFVLAAYHAFNYSLLGETGFHAMRHLVDGVPCFDLVYSDLEWALRALEGVCPVGTMAPQTQTL